MTKKEVKAFMKLYHDSIGTYMTYVSRKEEAPIDVIERAAALDEVRRLLIPNDDDCEDGA